MSNQVSQPRGFPSASTGGLGRAARNAWAVSWFGSGIEAGAPTPSEVLYDDPHARVSQISRAARGPEHEGDPVLLVTPLAVPARCWDLRPGQSLAAHLSGADGKVRPGRPTYVLDYGTITFSDRALGFEHWVDGIVPTAIRRISAEHDGAPVHVVGWSHGGTISLLTAAHDPDLPIASLVTLGTPVEYGRIPMHAAYRWIAGRFGAAVLTRVVGALGGVPAPLTQRMYRWMSPLRQILKPWTLATNLHREEILGRVEAVDRFIDAMPGYPGRFFNQSMTLLVLRDELFHGTVRLRPDLVVQLARLRAPLLLVGSTTDMLAPADSIEPGTRCFPNATVAQLTVEGLSHLGLVASPSAIDQTWPAVRAHLETHDTSREPLDQEISDRAGDIP